MVWEFAATAVAMEAMMTKVASVGNCSVVAEAATAMMVTMATNDATVMVAKVNALVVQQQLW